MISKSHVPILLVVSQFLSPSVLTSQIDPGMMPVRIFEVLDAAGIRLGIAIIAGKDGRGYQKDTESWRFSDTALMEIAEQTSLELTVLAQGEWNDRQVVEALSWRPQDAVEWTHPTRVEWTPREERLPPVTGGTYFGDPTLGGVEIAYSSRGASSLTWFKLVEGDYVLYDEGTVFRRSEAPETGSWWQGAIEI